jgi:hypothetical protein
VCFHLWIDSFIRKNQINIFPERIAAVIVIRGWICRVVFTESSGKFVEVGLYQSKVRLTEVGQLEEECPN